MMEIFNFKQGSSPLLVSIPHSGTQLPDAIANLVTEAGKKIADTDWHLNEVYDSLEGSDASVISATHSRYVIDLNRPSDGAPLYEGAPETALCPLHSFAGEPLYRQGNEPTTEHIQERIGKYWQPYHDQIRATLDRLKAEHGFAILWDAHSIRSREPMFFEGLLPDLNFGSNDGRSCDPDLSARLVSAAERSGRYSAVLNQRFKGGYITRAYGDPAHNVHSIQLEMTQSNYMMESPPWTMQPGIAAELSLQLRDLLNITVEWRPTVRATKAPV